MSYLFVYGTLRKGFQSEINTRIHSQLQYVSKAKVQAVLYDLGDYPGAVKTEEDNEVIGDVFWMDDPEKVLKELDEYEGEEYDRCETRVRLRNKESIIAWMYWYRGELEGKVIIHYKDYFNYLKHKKSAFINGAL